LRGTLQSKLYRQLNQGASAINAEKILHAHIPAIQQNQQELIDQFSGHFNPDPRREDY
jgi:hypothetical protein